MIINKFVLALFNNNVSRVLNSKNLIAFSIYSLVILLLVYKHVDGNVSKFISSYYNESSAAAYSRAKIHDQDILRSLNGIAVFMLGTFIGAKEFGEDNRDDKVRFLITDFNCFSTQYLFPKFITSRY